MTVLSKKHRQIQRPHSQGLKRSARTNSQSPTVWKPLMTQKPSWGNQAVQRMLRNRVIQAKLRVSKPGDQYEKEADRVAEQIMHMSEPLPQVEAACNNTLCPKGENETNRAETESDRIIPLIQHRTDQEEPWQTKGPERQTSKKTPNSLAKIALNYSSGQPLTAMERSFFSACCRSSFIVA